MVYGPMVLTGLAETSTFASLSWYAVQAKRYSESQVLNHLTVRSIPAFLPLMEVVRRRRGTRHPQLEPLFPGYLFVRMAPLDTHPDCWDAVRWSPGVRGILGMGERPVPVPDGVIHTIQDRIRDLGFVRPGARFAPGDPVRFRSGPMAGLESVFECALSRAGRVQVLMTLLGQVRRIEADELDLEPV